MNTIERLVIRALANYSARKPVVELGWIEGLAQEAADHIVSMQIALHQTPAAREEAKQLLNGGIGEFMRPLDFEVGCGCTACAERRQEWQRAKEGEL